MGLNQHRNATNGEVRIVKEVHRQTDLQRREYFSLFLSIYNVIVILHRDERCELVVDSIICSLLSDGKSYTVGG